jgi:hypothetical protein
VRWSARLLHLMSGLWVPEMLSLYATWAYSWIRPPSRSRRQTRMPAPSACGRTRPSGGCCCSVRCGRWVLMVHVLAQDQPQVPFAGDQDPIQALTAGAGNPAFRDRVRPRRLDRRLDDSRLGRGEHCVERCGELGIPVPDQELEAVSLIVEMHQHVAGLLGHPVTSRVSGDPGQVHAAGAVLDEEQHIQAVGFQNAATGLDLGFYAARSYSLMRPPSTGLRLIHSWERSARG